MEPQSRKEPRPLTDEQQIRVSRFAGVAHEIGRHVKAHEALDLTRLEDLAHLDNRIAARLFVNLFPRQTFGNYSAAGDETQVDPLEGIDSCITSYYDTALRQPQTGRNRIIDMAANSITSQVIEDLQRSGQKPVVASEIKRIFTDEQAPDTQISYAPSEDAKVGIAKALRIHRQTLDQLP